MTAAPTTFEILVNLANLARRADEFSPMERGLRDDIATFTQRITDTLPYINPVVVGQALLHTADLYGMFATRDNRQPLSAEALTAVQQRLYLGGQRNQHTGQ